jgi:hypothetical protein
MKRRRVMPFPCGTTPRARLPSPVAMGEGLGMRVVCGAPDAQYLPIPPPVSYGDGRGEPDMW